MDNLIKKRVSPPQAEPADSSVPAQEVKKSKRANRSGAGCKRRKQRKKEEKYLGKVRLVRRTETLSRASQLSLGNAQVKEAVGPFIGSRADADSHHVNVSRDTLDFYDAHPYGNEKLEVSERANVSNPSGLPGKGKGVFALKELAAGTRLCPYVGKLQARPCAVELECQYDLRLADKLFLCARDKLYDIGYLAASNMPKQNPLQHVREAVPTEPNFGRYFNTGKSEADNNCTFEIAGDGFDAIFLQSARAIRKGEELLVSYGNQFKIRAVDHVLSDDDRTVCDSEEDFA